MPPVLVTARQLEKLASTIETAALESVPPEPDEETEARVLISSALRKLREAEAETESAEVMVTAQDRLTSCLQSAIAEGEISPERLQPLPAGGLEAVFDEQDWLGWATVALAKLKNLRPHPLLRPASSDATAFPNIGRIGILGDWGTGLYGAPIIARTIEKEPDPYTMLLHLGDVYYSGSDQEVQKRFLDVWPKRSEAIMRALNSNHEMYSGGHGYFGATLPRFAQDASYFALQNEHWTFVGLDVAHNDHAINDYGFPNQQIDWLNGILAKAGDRKVVLFSHHQLFSHYESQGVKLWGDPGFHRILQSGRIFAWYWGHEHRCCIYEEPDPRSGIWARCLGHGGMPQGRQKTLHLPRAAEYERADWRRVAAAADQQGNRIPPALILEGPNPYFAREADKFSPHGFGTLVFDGPKLTEQVRDCDGHVIFEKELAS